jgi:broad specificity phosphatase PhoE
MANQTTRDNAPAYLAAYEARRAGAAARVVEESETQEPAFLLRARERALLDSLVEMDRDTSPPGRTEAFARETVAPRELQLPDSMRRKQQLSYEVRLIRHGQTQGYITDGALTPLGHWQARRKGQDLAKGLKEGMTVKLPHAPTARARETAEGVRSGILQALSRYGIGGVTVEDPVPNKDFDNFQVYVEDGKEMDCTAAFVQFANEHEDYQRFGDGDRPGWMTEMKRFFLILQSGGDPITHWLTLPYMYFEPPILVVRRHWKGILDMIGQSEPDTKIFVCGHSGPIRAVATAAVGHDPGEPHNTEDVRIRVFEGLTRAGLTYRGRGIEIEIPVTYTPSWYASSPSN